MVAGLGNPGPGYEHTRHNAGADWVRELARTRGARWRREPRFFGDVVRLDAAGSPVWLLVPETYMNRSGQAVAALLRFHRIAPAELLVVHDDLDLPPGTIRLKRGGGHGGHNGLRDIMQALGGAQDFARLRIGIGHPGSGADVVGYVLRGPAPEERRPIEAAFARGLDVLPALIAGDWDRATRELHTLDGQSDDGQSGAGRSV